MKKLLVLFRLLTICSLSGVLLQCNESPSSIPNRKNSYVDLVEKLTDLEYLSSLPAPGEKCMQWSSYDRTSRYDEATGKYIDWTANGDGSGIIRKEGDLDVFAEMEGPGIIWRIWSARADSGHVKIFLDGNPAPAVDLPFIHYFDRTTSPFIYPALVNEVSKGFNNYVPIPFQKSCKIVAEKNWGNFYHFTYTTYPPGTTLPTFKMNLTKEELAALEIANIKLTDQIGTDPKGLRQNQTTRQKVITVEPGKTCEVIKIDGTNAITAIKINVQNLPVSPADRDILRGLALSIKWDGEQDPSVWSPLGDFFGTAPGVNLYKSLPLGMTESGFYSYWYMPFEKSALVELKNDTETSQTVNFTIDYAPVTQPINSLGRFHAKWHLDTFLPSEPERRIIDWTMLKTEGRGRFCGVALHVWNPKGGWWGEGDEKFFIDGEKFPSTFGTGSEDYFGYAWCSPALFQNGYHNQTISNNHKGHVSVNRWQITDNIPFLKSFEGSIEKYFANSKPALYASTVYWYEVSGQKDMYKPVGASDRLGYTLQPEVLPEDKVLDGVFVKETDLVLTCEIKDAEIRYSLDGADPTEESTLYTRPIRINKTSTVKAKTFRAQDGKKTPISNTVIIKRTQTNYIEAVNILNTVSGVNYAYYEGDWNAMPDFTKLKPVRTGICGNFLMQKHQEDFFAFRFTGYIKVPYTGIYTFCTTSDDGSQLFIHNQLIVDNDGLHGPGEIEAQLALKAGYHPIAATMFEKGGGEDLDVFYAGPGINRRQIPKDVLFITKK